MAFVFLKFIGDVYGNIFEEDIFLSLQIIYLCLYYTVFNFELCYHLVNKHLKIKNTYFSFNTLTSFQLYVIILRFNKINAPLA